MLVKPGLFASWKAAEPGTAAVALIAKAPAVLLAVRTGAVATPTEFVVAMAEVPFGNEPEGPEPGAVNVTFTPATPLPKLSTTAAWSVVPKACPSGVL